MTGAGAIRDCECTENQAGAIPTLKGEFKTAARISRREEDINGVDPKDYADSMAKRA
jgi:hypothetical protein